MHRNRTEARTEEAGFRTEEGRTEVSRARARPLTTLGGSNFGASVRHAPKRRTEDGGFADATPPLRCGAVRMVRGQRYECVGLRPHRTRDGRITTLAVWETYCAACGAPFEALTPAGGKFEPNRRCAAHRAPGRRVA